ncbi:MAG: protein translocase subunit SecD [Patescibacteria group bacterium]|nr:protein translocase subunit SecD [Patescibacteria group bacterium]
MSYKKVYLTIFFIFVLAFLAGNYIEPRYWNNTADVINAQKNEIKYVEKLSNIPQFPVKDFVLGLDLKGGTHLVYEADMSKIDPKDYDSSLAGLRDVIERRVNMFGVQEPIVQTQETKNHHRLIIELAGVKDTGQAIKMIGETPFLEFKEQKDEAQTQEILDKRAELQDKTMEQIQEVENWEIALQDPYFKATELTGKYLKKSEIGFDNTTYEPLILLEFNNEGAEIFKELTKKNIGKPLAIYIDNAMISAPVIQDIISGGKAQITGKFTIEEAKKMARNLSAGALPVPITLISQQTIGPNLGQDSLDKSLKAGIAGFLAVLVFIIIFYRIPGILASIALIIYTALMLCIFKFIPVTLTLAGISGFILSIGMAIDANILIFSRMKEELNRGNSFADSVEKGFDRAWPSIRDGNLTSLLVVLILFIFGVGFIKGFALTLFFGILTSMFSAVYITKNFLRMFENTKLSRIKFLWR